MHKTCILITCDYPYDTGESFIENEIDYLSRVFQKIYIFPINAHNTDKMTRTPPKNSEVFPIGCVHSVARIPIYVFKGLFSHNNELKIWNLNPKRMVVNLYARGRSAYIYNFILKKIKECHIDCGNTMIYSYWFTDQALVAGMLRNSLESHFPTIKAVSRAHRYDLYWEENTAGYLPYQDISLKYLDSVHPCSDDGSNYLKRKYPIYSDKITTARLGTKDFGLAPQSEKTVFVTCCSLKKIKRISLFAEAFSVLAKENSECHWYCIGDGEEYAEIKKIIENNHIEDKVTLVGRLTNRQVIEFYIKNPISYFVNVSTSEGVPVSIMEAMSFGIPIIATNVGGSGEIVNEQNGVLLSPDINKEELVAVLLKVNSLSKQEFLKKRKAARMMWENLSSAEKNYNKWCDILLGKR